MNQLIRVLAQDLGTRGITVNAVAPGATATPLFLRTYPQEIIDRIASTYPAKRLGQPEEIAPVVAFLARDEANWVNGQTIYANNVRGWLCFLGAGLVTNVCAGSGCLGCTRLEGFHAFNAERLSSLNELDQLNVNLLPEFELPE